MPDGSGGFGGGSGRASNGPRPLGCCVSQRKVHLCLVSAQLSAIPPGSGNEPGELGACLQAELETKMQVSRLGERGRESLCPSATLIFTNVLLV